MNYVVCYPYLVHEILWHQQAHRGTLAACARVSRIWHNEACDLLWSEQDGLDNILKLLKPSKQNNSKDKHVRYYHVDFLRNRSLTEEQLKLTGLPSTSRLQHYSKWIRDIECDRDFSKRDNALVNAQVLAPGACLFPSLRRLAMKPELTIVISGLAVTVANCLIGPSLKEIDFGKSPSQVTALILATALTHPYGLVTFTMDSVTALREDRTIFCDFIRSAPNLEDVYLQASWVDFDMMQALGKLEHLWHLCLVDDRDQLVPAEPLNIHETLNRISECPEIWFPSLTSLLIQLCSVVNGLMLKTVFAHTQLSSLSVKFIVGDRDISNCISLPLDTSQITSLSFSWHGDALDADIDLAPQFPRLDKQALQCLSSCSSLEILSILHVRVPNLNDEDILSLAKCWPALQRLVIINHQGSFVKQDIPLTTVAILSQLPKLCPQLKLVTLTVAGTLSDPPAIQNLPAPYTAVNLHEYFLWDLDEPDRKTRIMEIAAYLCVVLPATCALRFWGSELLLGSSILHPGISSAEWSTLAASRKRSIDELTDYRQLSSIVRNLETAAPTNSASGI